MIYFIVNSIIIFVTLWILFTFKKPENELEISALINITAFLSCKEKDDELSA